jgi:hypothetical protein
VHVTSLAASMHAALALAPANLVQDPQASRRCVVASARRCRRPTYTLARAAVPLQAREICYFATHNFGCLLLCYPVSMTGGTVCVYDLWVRWHTGEGHK